MTTAHVDLENPWAGQGSVLLDIGALVVTMPTDRRSRSARRVPRTTTRLTSRGTGTRTTHVAVVNRPVPGGHVPSLVFGELAEGRYELYPKERHVVCLRVEVMGGQVATAEWPA